MNTARYIGETRCDGVDLHQELRYSDGTAVWPGDDEHMRLSRGYWLGTRQAHMYLGKLASAKRHLAAYHIEVLATHAVAKK